MIVSPPQTVQVSVSPHQSEAQSEEQPIEDVTPVLSTETHVEGTVHPAENFNANKDAEALRKEMKVIRWDSDAVLNILFNRSNAQRQKIRMMFNDVHAFILHSKPCTAKS